MAFLTKPAEGRSVVDLGALALLVPLLHKLNFADIIDRHIPTDPQAEFSHGQVLSVLLAARLQQPSALCNIAHWAQNHGVEYLCGIPPEKLNDDRLGRSLDALFEHRHAVLAEVTAQILRLTDLDLKRCHFDPTHLVLFGVYQTSRPRRHGPLETLLESLRDSPAHITRGYKTRYKMLQLGVTSVIDDLGALPVACHLFDGNRNGHSGIKEQYHLLRQFLHLPENLLLVSDRGTCSAEHLALLRRHGHYGLCAGQWQDYRALYEQQAATLCWQQASYLSQEQQRRRACNSSLPKEEYRYAVVDHQLIDPDTKTPLACRVVFVHSSAAAKESRQRREKNIVRIRAGLEAIAAKLCRGHPSTTLQSAARQIARLLGRKSAANYFQWELVPLTPAEVAQLPRPAKGHRLPTHRLVYSFAEAAAQADARHDGIYALVTTAPPATWSGDALLTEYKRQTHLERGHHELKTPLAVTPIFLKSPERVEGLVSLLFMALQAYMTLERLYRRSVSADAKPAEKHMTAERLLKDFAVCGLFVQQQSYGALIEPAALTPRQRSILSQLSLATPTQILKRNLSPPPT
jgi:transposase